MDVVKCQKFLHLSATLPVTPLALERHLNMRGITLFYSSNIKKLLKTTENFHGAVRTNLDSYAWQQDVLVVHQQVASFYSERVHVDYIIISDHINKVY